MAIADSKALLADIMNVVDDHVTAKASKLLEKQIMDILDGYQIATMIRNDSGNVDNSRQLIDAFIAAKTAEGLAKSSISLYRNRLTRLYEDVGVPMMFNRMSKKTGIHVFAHRFRHTLAQTLLDRGMRIEEVQQILGHEKVETTRRYCHASQRNTENSYRKYACM